jgi:hypothetical protein
VDSRLWPCTACGEITEFVQPPCADGHTEAGGECPEWACVDCGSAVVMGESSPAGDVVRTRVAA